MENISNTNKLTTSVNTKQVMLVGSVVYIMQIIFAGIFYKERTIFTDIAFHVFQIIKNGTFAIQNNRFGAVCTQIFPLVASKLNLSLQQIAIIYSEAFIIFYFFIFLIIVKCIKNIKVALAWLGFNTILVTHTFYWVQSELPQAMAFAFLFFAIFDNVLKREHIPKLFYLVAFVLLVIVCFTHPLLIFAEVFVLVFFFFSYNKKRKIISSVLLLVVVLYVTKSIFFITGYDNNAMSGLKNIWLLFPNYFQIKSNINFIGYLFHDYYFILLLLILVLGFYIIHKDYKKFVLVSFFFLGYLFIVNISYTEGTSQYYIENQYLILSVFLLLPFLYDIFPAIKIRYQLIGISFFLIISLYRIYNTHDIYTTRLDWQRQFLVKTSMQQNKKLIVLKDKVPMELLMANWASDLEFWMLSTIENNSSRSIIIIDNKDQITWQKYYNKIFITKWETPDYNTLNKKYFIFTDTTYYSYFE